MTNLPLIPMCLVRINLGARRTRYQREESSMSFSLSHSHADRSHRRTSTNRGHAPLCRRRRWHRWHHNSMVSTESWPSCHRPRTKSPQRHVQGIRLSSSHQPRSPRLQCREAVRSTPTMTQILHDWGLADKLAKISTPINQMTFLDGQSLSRSHSQSISRSYDR